MYVFGNRAEVMKDDVPVRPIEFEIRENGVAVDISGINYNVKAIAVSDDSVYFDRAATKFSDIGGIVHVYPGATETDTVGEYRMYVYNADAPDTFPTGSVVEYAVLAL